MMTVNISEPKLLNMVIYAHYMKPFKLTGKASNAEYFHEKEIFPAALISRWAPAHIAIFDSGSLLLTGIKTWSQYKYLINELTAYLHTSSSSCNGSRS